MDAIMTLVDNGHKGEIILFSPDGLLPRVQPIEIKKIERKKLRLDVLHSIQRKTLKQPQIKDIFRCFQQEVEGLENR